MSPAKRRSRVHFALRSGRCVAKLDRGRGRIKRDFRSEIPGSAIPPLAKSKREAHAQSNRGLRTGRIERLAALGTHRETDAPGDLADPVGMVRARRGPARGGHDRAPEDDLRPESSLLDEPPF